MTDEQIIWQALNNRGANNELAPEGFAALERLTARCLPELPEGWEYDGVGIATGGWTAAIKRKHPTGTKIIFSTTKIDERPNNPRAAVLQAIEKIGRQP